MNKITQKDIHGTRFFVLNEIWNARQLQRFSFVLAERHSCAAKLLNKNLLLGQPFVLIQYLKKKKSSTNSNRKLFQHSYLDQLDKISLYFDLHVWTIVFGRPWSDICIEATDTLLTGMYPVTDPQRTRLLYLVQPIWFHRSIHLFLKKLKCYILLVRKRELRLASMYRLKSMTAFASFHLVIHHRRYWDIIRWAT